MQYLEHYDYVREVHTCVSGMYVCMCMCVCVCMCIYVCVYIYTHICMCMIYIYIYIYIIEMQYVQLYHYIRERWTNACL